MIINYNYAIYLRQAVDSALAQTHPDFEVVIVDDGSTDSSLDIIKSYGDLVRPVFQENGGLAAACNTGWLNARGDAVLFLDADDIVLPEMASKVSAALESTDAVKVQFMLQCVDAGLRPTGARRPTYEFSDRDPRRDIAQWGYYVTPPQSGNVYRKSFLDEILPVPVPPTYDLPMDAFATGLAGMTGRVATINEPLGLYRVHGANMSDAGRIESIKKVRDLFMRDYNRELAQSHWAERLHWENYRIDLARFHPTICKQRLIAYRLQPEQHPIQGDGRWSLLLCGLWGSIRFPYMRPYKRVFVAVGFIVLAVAPLSAIRKLTSNALSPIHGRSLLQRIIGY